jgi:hypothetical protein
MTFVYINYNVISLSTKLNSNKLMHSFFYHREKKTIEKWVTTFQAFKFYHIGFVTILDIILFYAINSGIVNLLTYSSFLFLPNLDI